MQYELCTTYNLEKSGREPMAARCPLSEKFGSWIDNGFEWITEKLDRKFALAMERSVNDDPVRKQELTVLKRTVLVLVCLGLGITSVSIKYAIEAQIIYLALG